MKAKLSLTIITIIGLFGFTALLTAAPQVNATTTETHSLIPSQLADAKTNTNSANAKSSSSSNSDICSSDAAPSVKDAAGCGENNDALPDIIVGIINAVIAVSGIVAVIYVIIGGVGYMTSNGDTGKLEKSKKTILYACIGLAICALSFAIVNFAISRIIEAESSSGTNSNNNNTSNNSNNS